MFAGVAADLFFKPAPFVFEIVSGKNASGGGHFDQHGEGGSLDRAFLAYFKDQRLLFMVIKKSQQIFAFVFVRRITDISCEVGERDYFSVSKSG